MTTTILLKKIKKRDMNALLDWFDVRQSKLYKIGWAYLKNHHDVEDIFHNTILKVHDNIGQLKEDNYFETWVTSIFINECRAVYRKKEQIAPERVESGPLDSQLELLNDLDRLEDIHKEVIILKYLQGYSQLEIADILNLPVGTVKSRLYRGLIVLRQLIEGGGNDEL
ncbi:RNA polymerase sigma factor [Sporosarcina sp. YIM B06819]|uniref:RNA polymerase sigma factor n=1 Tax=Sporosarcina sp. YIM B06819 TaxID=3081769 RepID=UPI00298BFFFF|nr:sigma-70 family RNA polymerase sigma factor [Sporosarcina sp. YIM B06819]